MAKQKRIMQAFKMTEISAVNRPAQGGALKTIMKRSSDLDVLVDLIGRSVTKAMDMGDGEGADPQSFTELLAEREECAAEWEAEEELWPLFCALQDSIKAVAIDTSRPMPDRVNAIRQNIEDFMNAVRAKLPDVEQELSKLLKAAPAIAGVLNPDTGGSMSDALKKELDDLRKQFDETIKKHQSELATSAAALKAATEQVAALQKAAEIAKADETLTSEGVTIRKSDVGESAFAFMKAQAEKIELATFEKAAESTFRHLPGELVAKAKGLRAISKLAKDDREAVEAMLKAGDAALKMTFKAAGADGGDAITKAADKLDAMVKDLAKKENITEAVAYTKVLDTKEGRELYAKAEAEKQPVAA